VTVAVPTQVNYAPAVAFVLASLLFGVASVVGVGYWTGRLVARLGYERRLLAGIAGAVACLGFYRLLYGSTPRWRCGSRSSSAWLSWRPPSSPAASGSRVGRSGGSALDIPPGKWWALASQPL